MPSSRSREAAVVYSVCATNYNCAHALRPHLASVVRAFDGLPFEYIVVDNFSRDGSWDIFQEWAASRSDVTLLRNRSTMGRGRNVAAAAARGSRIVVVDTDVVYRQEARTAVEAWDRICPDLAVQLPLLGLYPRPVWDAVGGRGDLNTYEDVDMWLRIHALGRMRWCLVPMGENLKEAEAHGGGDYASRRYPPRERIRRLLRREWDLLRTRHYEGIDIERIVRANSVDLGLGTPLETWVKNRPVVPAADRMRVFGRLVFQLMRGRGP